jgi:hypothetical protein
MIENDPYLQANNQARKFKGREDEPNQGKIDGVDWGIDD